MDEMPQRLEGQCQIFLTHGLGSRHQAVKVPGPCVLPVKVVWHVRRLYTAHPWRFSKVMTRLELSQFFDLQSETIFSKLSTLWGSGEGLPIMAKASLILSHQYPQAKQTDPNSLIDPSFVRRIEQSGFIRALYRK